MEQNNTIQTIPAKRRNITGIIMGIISALLLWPPIFLPGLEFSYFLSLTLAVGPLFHKNDLINCQFPFTLFVALGPLPFAIGMIQTVPLIHIKILVIIMLALWGSINYFLAKLVNTSNSPLLRLFLAGALGFGNVFLLNKISPLGVLFSHQMVSCQPTRWFIGLTRTLPSLLLLLTFGYIGIFIYVNIITIFIKKLSFQKKLYKIGVSLALPLLVMLYGHLIAPLLANPTSTPDRQFVIVQSNISNAEMRVSENSSRVTDKIINQVAAIKDSLEKGALVFTNEIMVRNYLIQQDYRNYKKLTNLTQELEGEMFWGTYYAEKAEDDNFNVYAAMLLIGPEGLQGKSFRAVMLLQDREQLKPQAGNPDSSFITTKDGIRFLITQCTDICKAYRGLEYYDTNYDLLYASSNNSNTFQFGKFDMLSSMIKSFASFICAKENKYGIVLFARGKSFLFNTEGKAILATDRDKAQIILCNFRKDSYRIIDNN